MSSISDDIKYLLTAAGLTDRYSQDAYTALLNRPDATASQLAHDARIPPSKIYETLSGLERRGLLTRIDARPNRFLLNPPKNAFSPFLNREKEALQNAQTLLAQLRPSNIAPAAYDIRILAGRTHVLEAIASDLQSISKSYEAFVGLSSPYPAIYNTIKQKLKEGVRIRYLSNINTPQRFRAAHFYTNLGITIHHYPLEAPLRFSLHDRARLVFTLSDSRDDWVTILTDSRPLLKIMGDLFDHYWKNSIPLPESLEDIDQVTQ